MLARVHNDELDTGPRRTAPGAERYCAATGVVKPVADMIRFVISPTGEPVPDLKRRLPGRGLWITATRAALRTAVAGKVFARGFKREIHVASDFLETADRLIENAALDALAITHKAHKVAIGFAKAEAAIAQSPVAGLLHATDAAPDGVRKLHAALHRRFDADADKLPVIASFASAQLDLALGRSNVIHAALLAGPESETFLARTARLDRFRATGTNRTDAPRGSELNARNH
jgi:predicted RNA-binding protein YlxR (DUF448 family)